MSVYKSLNSQDIIVSPFEVNKSFTFTGGDTLLSASIERHVCSSNISSSLYNSIKQLYYSNYISGSNGEISNATTASIGSDGLLSGPTYNTLYDNYLSTDLNPQRYFPGNNIGVMSIPKNLYGDYIQPNSFNLTCSGSRYVDNGEGIIQKYQEPYFAFCAPEDFDPASQPVNIIDIFNKYSKLDKKYIFTLRDTLETFELTEGNTAIHGYELLGISYRQNYNVGDTITLQGTKRWVIINSSSMVECTLYDLYGKVGGEIDFHNVYEWLYCGKYINNIRLANSSLAYYGAGSVKYIHLEIESQLTTIKYCAFYFAIELTGILTIPLEITQIGKSIDEGGAGLTFAGCAKIEKVIIKNNINFIGQASFGEYNGFGKLTMLNSFYSYANIAPTIPAAVFSNYPVPLHIKPGATGYDVTPWTDTAVFSEIIEDLSEDTNYVGNIIYEHGIIVLTNDSNINTFVSSSNITASFSSSYQLYETQYKCTITENEYNYTNNPSLTSGSDGKLYDHFTGSYFAPYITTVGLYNDNEELLAVGKLSQPLPTSRTTDTNIIISLDRL